MLVLGAGLAGLAATERLLDAGMDVTVVESFPLPGGRTANFDVPVPVAGLRPGDVVEHGLHAWFQHYHALYGLMSRAGVPKPPFAGEGVYFWNPEHGHTAIQGGPFSWLVNALRLPDSMRGDSAPALRGLFWLTGNLSRLLGDEGTDEETAEALLRRAKIPSQAISNVFRPCLYSLTSLPLERLSALEMLRWMASIVPDPRIRVLQGGGTAAMCGPIAAALRERGADFRFGVEATRLSLGLDGRARVELAQAPDRTGLRHVLVQGFEPAAVPDQHFDGVVSTLPWERLLALTTEDTTLARHPIWLNLRTLRNIHPLTIRLWFEHPLDGAAEHYILSTGTLFDVLRPTAEPHRYGGIRLVDALVENVETHLPELNYTHERYLAPCALTEGIIGRVLADLERMYPGQIRANRVVASFLHTREGIVAANPGVWKRRPPQYIGSKFFVLGGDWTRQPFGVCMEGAVRSGQLAAEALLRGKDTEVKPWAFRQSAYSAWSLFVRS